MCRGRAGPGGQGTTGFVAFDGQGLEPFDGKGPVKTSEDNWFYNYVDMNRNGYRDFRETVTQAWRRLGLLQHHEAFSRSKYTSCVQAAVETLRAEKFLSPKTAQFYVERAATLALPKN